MPVPAFEPDSLLSQLRAGADALGLDLSDAMLSRLIAYLSLLTKWNAVYNLTAVRDPQQMVTQHLLDSLAAVPAFTGAKTVLDVGAGGGLPGIVLAIVMPHLQIHLVDTVHKKTAFLTQVKADLQLAHVTVHTARVEQLKVAEPFDVITSRAFAELGDFVTWSGHLLKKGGHFIALKGIIPQDEIARLPEQWRVTEIRRLHVPGLPAERHLIIIETAAPQESAT